MPRVSILIVNWNTRDLLRDLLVSLQSSTSRENSEVIVVDNFSSDGSAAMVRDEFPGVHLIASERNTGYAAGNNLAFARASGAYLLTLNPDTTVFPETIATAIEVMDSHQDIGALGARQISIDGETQASVRGFPTLMGIVGDLTGLAQRLPRSIWDSYRLTGFNYEEPGFAPQPMGTFLFFRREALPDEKHPFDERFPIFFNEVDLLKRMADAGWPAYYDPSVQIRHYGGESTRQVRPLAIWESHRSLLRYFGKHWSLLRKVLVMPWFAPMIYISALIRARGYQPVFRP